MSTPAVIGDEFHLLALGPKAIDGDLPRTLLCGGRYHVEQVIRMALGQSTEPSNPGGALVDAGALELASLRTYRTEKGREAVRFETPNRFQPCRDLGAKRPQPHLSLPGGTPAPDVVVIYRRGPRTDAEETRFAAQVLANVSAEGVKPPLIVLQTDSLGVFARRLAEGFEKCTWLRHFLIVANAAGLSRGARGIRTDGSLECAARDALNHIQEARLVLADSPKHRPAWQHVVIRLSPTAALRVHVGGPTLQPQLHYVIPNASARESPLGGRVVGLTTLLVASVVRAWHDGAVVADGRWLDRPILQGLRLGSQLSAEGYRQPEHGEQRDVLTVIAAKIGEEAEWIGPYWPRDETTLQLGDYWNGPGPLLPAIIPSHQSFFPIAWKAAAIPRVDEFCAEILENGEEGMLRHKLPFGRIGDLTMLESHEIDSMFTLRKLLQRYVVEDPSKARPWSLGVFGAPGSGKSFSALEVAKSLTLDSGKLRAIVFNLSQFTSADSLALALHKVRDIVLEGDVPFTFFDEFDGPLQNHAFGWLKYFLAPMQDGTFRQGETEYHIGRAIFVFAGGLNRSFAELRGRSRNPDFCEAKGPDFVSRLRWHIDIPTLDLQSEQAPPEDLPPYAKLRRALLLHGICKRRGLGHSPIARDLLAAFLAVERYYHGVRSMDSVVRLCEGDGGQLRAHHLPPNEALEMHVPAREFRRAMR